MNKDYQVHLTPKSSNQKTGPIPVSTTTNDTCPSSCPFNHINEGGCYAGSGPLKLHWDKVSAKERGTSWDEFCNTIINLPEGSLWRHNQAGDLPGDGSKIDKRALNKLVKANKGKRGFTYTHYPLTKHNTEAIFKANHNGFTVNVSLNNLEELWGNGAFMLPLTVVVPEDVPKSFTHAGFKVATCPATYKDTNCEECKLCAEKDRKVVVAFPVHGTQKKRAGLVAGSGEKSNFNCA